MFTTWEPPPELRDLVSNPELALGFQDGRRKILDGVDYKHRRGWLIAYSRRVLAIGNCRAITKGSMRVTVAQFAQVTARDSSVIALHNARVVALGGTDAEMTMQSRFIARDQSHIYVYGEASGIACDRSVVFIHEGAAGRVEVRSDWVRIVDYRAIKQADPWGDMPMPT